MTPGEDEMGKKIRTQSRPFDEIEIFLAVFGKPRAGVKTVGSGGTEIWVRICSPAFIRSDFLSS